MNRPPNELELRDGTWVPAGAPDGELLLRLADHTRHTPETKNTLALSGLEGLRAACPQCGVLAPYILIAEPLPDGGELQRTKPCVVCEYSEEIARLPKRAIELRGRIQRMQREGVNASTTKRYNSLLRQYKRAAR